VDDIDLPLLGEPPQGCHAAKERAETANHTAWRLAGRDQAVYDVPAPGQVLTEHSILEYAHRGGEACSIQPLN
jgi:hypothetical protein